MNLILHFTESFRQNQMFNPKDQATYDVHNIKQPLNKGIIEYTPQYKLLTSEEKLEYFYTLGEALIKGKVAYYLFDSPVYSDLEYDTLERLYEAVARDIEMEPDIINMVGVNMNNKECIDAYNNFISVGLVPRKVDNNV